MPVCITRNPSEIRVKASQELVLISEKPNSSQMMADQVDRILESSDPHASHKISLFKNCKIDYSNNSINFRSMNLPVKNGPEHSVQAHSFNHTGKLCLMTKIFTNFRCIWQHGIDVFYDMVDWLGRGQDLKLNLSRLVICISILLT